MANDDGNRNRAGRYADVRDVAERDMRMARLAAQRKSHTEIARLEGCSERTVARGVKRALSAWRAQGGKEFADRILNDLEAVYAGLWEIVEDPGHKVSPAGKLVTGLDGEPVVNLDLRTDAYDKLRKLLADTRALLGTDAPKRSVQARVEVDLDSSCCRAGGQHLAQRVALTFATRPGPPQRSRTAHRWLSSLGRKVDACSSESADYFVVQGVMRHGYTVFPSELAQLGHGVAKGVQLLLGEAAHASHRDLSCSRASGVIQP